MNTSAIRSAIHLVATAAALGAAACSTEVPVIETAGEGSYEVQFVPRGGDPMAVGAFRPETGQLTFERDLAEQHEGDTAVFVAGQETGPVRIQPGVTTVGDEVALDDEVEVYSVAGSGPHYLDQESPIGSLRFTRAQALASEEVATQGYCGQETQYCYWTNGGYCQKCLYGVTCYGWYGEETWCW